MHQYDIKNNILMRISATCRIMDGNDDFLNMREWSQYLKRFHEETYLKPNLSLHDDCPRFDLNTIPPLTMEHFTMIHKGGSMVIVVNAPLQTTAIFFLFIFLPQ